MNAFWKFEGAVYGLELGTNEGTELVLGYGRVLGTTLGDMYGLPLDTYYGSDLGSLECSSDENTDGKFEGLSLGDWLGSVKLLTDMGVAALMYLLVAASKVLYSKNITAHTVSSVARSATTMVEIFHLSQKQGLREVVARLVSKVNFKRPTSKNSVAIIKHYSSDKTMHAHDGRHFWRSSGISCLQISRLE